MLPGVRVLSEDQCPVKPEQSTEACREYPEEPDLMGLWVAAKTSWTAVAGIF